ncbi:MAG: cob(I)yrinic acid a,c-diamide adenosyltransferase, partial [Alphaproteobacteria bacterium]|nr:cob(I)yrinic acid a,c-diamide adenosyltransferase [Alphaproteobacteria bacterium]
AGETSLGDGARVRKDALRVEAYGTVDEANAIVGLARLHTQGPADEILGRVQNDLFDLGADLCRPEDGRKGEGGLRVSAGQVERLETEIDRLNADLAPLESFILPGGTPAAAHLHQARTVTRRAERLTVALAAEETVNDQAIKYLNRLSDLLFVMARHCNDQGAQDVLWTPGANR